MALFTSHSSANKVQDVLPATRSVQTPIHISGYEWVMQTETIYTESFRYVGMTKAAAETCVAAMIAAYTEVIMIPVINEGTIGYQAATVCVADVKGVHVGGNMWEVSVDVNRREVEWGAGS